MKKAGRFGPAFFMYARQFLITVTLNDPLAVLPAASDAEHITVVVPTGNLVPDDGEHCTDRLPLMASVADTEKFTFTPDEDDVVTEIAGSGARTGATVSLTITLNAAVALFPESSVATQATVVVPTGNVAPDAAEQRTGTVGSTASLAVAVNDTGAPRGPVASARMS